MIIREAKLLSKPTHMYLFVNKILLQSHLELYFKLQWQLSSLTYFSSHDYQHSEHHNILFPVSCYLLHTTLIIVCQQTLANIQCACAD